MTTVIIRECKTDGRTWTSQHRTDDPAVAQQRAIARHFGRGAGWWRDSGLGCGYGQVVVSAGVSQYSCITGRVRIDIE